MTNTDKPFKEGYLLLPPKSTFIPISKPWQKKFCKLFKSSKQGLERLELFDNENDVKNSTNPIITLENCVKISEDVQKNQAHVFAVITKSGVHHFSAASEDEMTEWILALQAVAFKDTASRQTIEEDNELYCSSGDTGVFSVKLVSSEASERCGLESGTYTLKVTPSTLQLNNPVDNSTLVTWPYRFIRRYAIRCGKLQFEAGRSCSTGEGWFQFEHTNQQEIFRCISAQMKIMKRLLSGESLEFGNSQFNAVLGMTPRSRSPLPPSPTGSNPTMLDSEFGSMASMKGMLAFHNFDSSPTGDRPSLPTEKHLSLFEKHNSRRKSADNFLSNERSPSSDRSLSKERTLSSDRLISSPLSERPLPASPPTTLRLPLRPIPTSVPLTPLSPSLSTASSPITQMSLPLSLHTSPPPTEKPPPIPTEKPPPLPSEKPPPPPPKPKLSKPEKPPRKSLPCLKLDIPPRLKKDVYDDVEVRSEAWRTLGTDSTPHCERGERVSIIPPKSSNEPVHSSDSQKIFTTAPSPLQINDYDKLQHLGTTSKLTSPGYRQVGPSLIFSGKSELGSRDDLDMTDGQNMKHISEYTMLCKPNRV